TQHPNRIRQRRTRALTIKPNHKVIPRDPRHIINRAHTTDDPDIRQRPVDPQEPIVEELAVVDAVGDGEEGGVPDLNGAGVVKRADTAGGAVMLDASAWLDRQVARPHVLSGHD